MSPAVALLAVVAIQQPAQPLRKSDLIRLLATPTIAPAEVAEMVRRNCLSFTPSARDRSDLQAMGADALVLRRIDECTRRTTALRANARVQDQAIVAGARTHVQVDVRRGDEPAAGVRLVLRGSGRFTGGPDLEGVTDARGRLRLELTAGAAPGAYRVTIATARGEPLDNAPTLDVMVRPAPVVAAPSRTGFVSGLGQKARVGTKLALPLVFEARDASNAPVIGQLVTLSAINAQLDQASGTTDSTGRVRVFAVLGRTAGAVRIVATLGRIEREAAAVAVAGPPARLTVRCGAASMDGRLALAPGTSARFDVTAADAFGNAVALTGMRVSVGDESVARAQPDGVDSSGGRGGRGGRFTLRAGKAGATNLIVLGSGLRESFVAAVSKEAGTPDCRAGGPGG